MERRLKEHLPGGAFSNVNPVRSRTMAAIKGKHAKSTERALRMVLVRAGISGWTLHADQLPGKPDFFFPKHQLAIFVDGCFWHGCARRGHVPKTNSVFWAAKLRRTIQRDGAKTKKAEHSDNANMGTLAKSGQRRTRYCITHPKTYFIEYLYRTVIVT